MIYRPRFAFNDCREHPRPIVRWVGLRCDSCGRRVSAREPLPQSPRCDWARGGCGGLFVVDERPNDLRAEFEDVMAEADDAEGRL